MKTRIKEFRARHNLTQEVLAKKVGVRRETIVFLEKGKYNPSLQLAHKIAVVLKTTIDELFIFSKKWLDIYNVNSVSSFYKFISEVVFFL